MRASSKGLASITVGFSRQAKLYPRRLGRRHCLSLRLGRRTYEACKTSRLGCACLLQPVAAFAPAATAPTD